MATGLWDHVHRPDESIDFKLSQYEIVYVMKIQGRVKVEFSDEYFSRVCFLYDRLVELYFSI